MHVPVLLLTLSRPLSMTLYTYQNFLYHFNHSPIFQQPAHGTNLHIYQFSGLSVPFSPAYKRKTLWNHNLNIMIFSSLHHSVHTFAAKRLIELAWHLNFLKSTCNPPTGNSFSIDAMIVLHAGGILHLNLKSTSSPLTTNFSLPHRIADATKLTKRFFNSLIYQVEGMGVSGVNKE